MGLYLIKKYKEKMREKKIQKKYLKKQFIGYKIKDKKIMSYYIEFKKGDFYLYEEENLIYSIDKFSKIKEKILKEEIISELRRD